MFIILLFVGASVIAAQETRAQRQRLAQTAKAVAVAYKMRDLGRLDRLGLIRGTVKIVIEHSIPQEESEQFVVRRFSSFYRAERWLANRHPQPGLPFRAVQSFAGCRKGRCAFDEDGGILHNQLYLKSILYGYQKGRPFIKELYFYDGD
jgi:hypothetical protein